MQDDFKTQYASMYDDWREETGTFMTGVLNAGDYSYDLGQSFAKVIEDRYRLGTVSYAYWHVGAEAFVVLTRGLRCWCW